MFNTNIITNLFNKVQFNSSSKNKVSTTEIDELLMEIRIKRYGMSRELVDQAATFNIDWDYQKNGIDGLENAIEEAKRNYMKSRAHMYREYYESRV